MNEIHKSTGTTPTMNKQFSKIHPELQQLAKMTPQMTFNKKMLWFTNLMTHWMPSPKISEDVLIENVFIPGRNAPTKIRLRIYKPTSIPAATPVLIWMHGGGYLIGKPEMDDFTCAEYVRELGIVVISVDYHLAPKHPFPAGLNDCYDALKWAVSHSEELHLDPNRIAIGGRSAGGGLAAALAQLAHDQQEIRPVFQLLIYPMLDDRTVLRVDIDDSSNVTWNQKSNRFGWESYLGMKCGAGDVPAYSVPARREELSGLPPAWVGVGSLDIFHNEDVAYAQKMKECGVECEINVVQGAFHGFDVFDAQIPIVQNFQKAQIAALKKYLFNLTP